MPRARLWPVIQVTGAAGQLGRQLVARGASPLTVDITDAEAVLDAVAPGAVVINCAAYTKVDAAETDEAAAFEVNATGAGNVAAACRARGARVIHVSTDYVFDGTATVPYEPGDPTGPATAYGRTKLAGEQLIGAAGTSSTIVRTAWVYTGAGSDFVATMLRLESERDTLDVVDDQIGSPTYSGDLADGLLELSGIDAPPVLHLTNAGQASWFELARAVFEEIGADPQRVRPCTSAQFVRPAPRPKYSVLSLRAWSAAGLTPPRPWRDALRAAMDRVGA